MDDGKETVIEKPEFLVQALLTNDYYNELVEKYDMDTLKASDKARNIALVYKIEDGVMSNENDVVILDNDLKVLYTYERIIEQQELFGSGIFGYETLANGDKLVDIGGEEMPYAIVSPDGTVRAYLKAGMRVVGNYVADGTFLYDYDLNVICNYAEKNYTVTELFGECVFISYNEGRCMSFNVYDEQIHLNDLFEDEVSLVERNDDYAVFYNRDTGKYTLYNESMKAILASRESMDIYALEDGGYLVMTYAGADYACYILK